MIGILEREDWTLFRSVETLCQKAGVSIDELPALIAKELVDNALDASGDCSFGYLEGGGVYVENPGEGLHGTDEEIGELFSVSRSLASSKLLRLPTRGALGNGLRVVMGAVLSSGGSLTVRTGGRSLRLQPRDSDGGTDVELVGAWKGEGTRVELVLGASLELADEEVFGLATRAKLLARGDYYRGRPSPWWYDSDSFFELCQAAPGTARELVADLDGCSGARSGRVAADFAGFAADSLKREESERLLVSARANARPVKPARLGRVGADALDGYAYARTVGEFLVEAGRGTVPALLPYVVEAWARPAPAPAVAFHVNRTPVAAVVEVGRDVKDKGYNIFGAGLAHGFKVGRRDVELWINVITPHMPITTDGKAPDLERVLHRLRDAIELAARKASRGAPQEKGSAAAAAAAIVRAALEKWEEEWKPDGIVPTVRQVFYALAVAKLVPKSQKGYQSVSTVLARAREEGAYPWEGIADPLRQIRRQAEWSSVAEYLDEVREGYRLDKWEAQPRRVELWTEKDALTGALARVTDEFEVPVLVVRGYSSATAKHAAAERMERDGKPTSVLYVGDFDPSGLDMFDGTVRWIRGQLGESGHVEFVRLGVTEEDFRSGEFPRLPVNPKDKRAPKYRAAYGDEVMEAEALPPAMLRDRIRRAILERRDAGLWAAELEREAGHRAELARRLTKLTKRPSGKRRAPGKAKRK